MSVPPDLLHFTASEFSHPELMDSAFCYFLDRVRGIYGQPLIVTCGARTPEENARAPGSSPTSLHLIGRAADLRWIPESTELYNLVAAVIGARDELGVAAPEIELVPGPVNAHIHLGLFPPGGVPALEIHA